MLHPKSTEMVRSVYVGQERFMPWLEIDGVVQRYVVLALGPVTEDTDGHFASRLILRTNPNNTLHPFVVEKIIYNDERGVWDRESGTYAGDIYEAIKFFEKRVY